MEIVLASASPRRRELLSLITEHFTVCPCRCGRNPAGCAARRGSHPSFPPQGRGCAGAAPERRVHRLGYHGHDRRTAPRQAEGRGRGRFHAPPSARTHPRGADRTCRAHAGRRAHTLHTCTRVTFRDFAEDELAAYLATREPLDKAGAYGIQGHGALLIKGIEGDYYSVMGSACGSALYHSARYSCGISRIYLLKFHISVQHYERKIRFATTS